MFIQTLLNVLLVVIKEKCISANKSTYIIPSAQLCIPTFETKDDGYLFGPCNTTSECELTLEDCRFAPYRDKYCFTNDAHFCALQNSGNYTNYYLVECG